MAKKALDLPPEIIKLIFTSEGEYKTEWTKKLLGNGPLPKEKIPNYAVATKEEVLHNGNAFVVLGKDRPGVLGSGNSKETDCATIDIVTGRMGTVGTQIAEEYPGSYVSPCTALDAARIYISERTNVDDNFNLTPMYAHYELLPGGTPAFKGSVKNKSAIAMKADNLRLISREGIKIIAMSDKLNSKNQSVLANYGIDLIGGFQAQSVPNSNIQPLVKGRNLVACLRELHAAVTALDSHVAMHNMALLALAAAGGFHFHAGAVGPTSPDVNPATIAAKISATQHAMMSTAETNLKQFNHVSLSANFFEPFSETYICSIFNKTT